MPGSFNQTSPILQLLVGRSSYISAEILSAALELVVASVSTSFPSSQGIANMATTVEDGFAGSANEAENIRTN